MNAYAIGVLALAAAAAVYLYSRHQDALDAADR